MNANEHRFFLAFACGEANNKGFIRVYLRSSVAENFFNLSLL